MIRLISEPMAQLYRVVPLELSGNRLTVASAEPQKIQIADELRTFLGYDIHVCVATEPEIQKTIEKLYLRPRTRAWNRSSTTWRPTTSSPPRPRPPARRGRPT